MRLRELFEARQRSVGIIFGRFNPPHKGHRAAWEMASENDAWFVGTNQSTQGPKDPLPYDVKIEAMKAIYPEIKGHIMPEQSWLTMASAVYKKYGNVVLNLYTDEEWVSKAINQYNGQEGPHGFYNFSAINTQPTPRLSSATALRAAVQAGDREAFADAAGVDADTPVAGQSFFDLVAQYLNPYAEKEKAKAAKKKVKEPVAELSNELLGRYKKAAGVDAKKADADGDYKRADKRFSGIVKATKKQFANDMKKHEPANEEAAGVGIITKQNTTVDVNKNTPKKNLKAFRLA
jgi:nicotinamide mononucleotide adenylyltransferase